LATHAPRAEGRLLVFAKSLREYFFSRLVIGCDGGIFFGFEALTPQGAKWIRTRKTVVCLFSLATTRVISVRITIFFLSRSGRSAEHKKKRGDLSKACVSTRDEEDSGRRRRSRRARRNGTRKNRSRGGRERERDANDRIGLDSDERCISDSSSLSRRAPRDPPAPAAPRVATPRSLDRASSSSSARVRQSMLRHLS
jgi:hypothetical protein